jgi:hypothetical protein
VKVLVYLGIVVLVVIGYTCGTKSNAGTSGTVDKLPGKLSAGKDIDRDIDRIKTLYAGFNKIAQTVVNRNRIEPQEIGKLNKIISELKYYELVYSQLFFQKEIERTAYMVMMSDPDAQKIMSDYVFLTRQLQNVEGRQFINL